jgi:hypothetical protein
VYYGKSDEQPAGISPAAQLKTLGRLFFFIYFIHFELPEKGVQDATAQG